MADTLASKLFPDDTSLFSAFRNMHAWPLDFYNELIKISNLVFQWEMEDSMEYAQEFIFSRKKQMQIYPTIHFNQNTIMQTNSQKHLGVLLYSQLDINEHVTNRFTNTNKNVGLPRKFWNILPSTSLLTIYKSLYKTET